MKWVRRCQGEALCIDAVRVVVYRVVHRTMTVVLRVYDPAVPGGAADGTQGRVLNVAPESSYTIGPARVRVVFEGGRAVAIGVAAPRSVVVERAEERRASAEGDGQTVACDFGRGRLARLRG